MAVEDRAGGPPVALPWSGVSARRMARHGLVEPAADVGPAAIASVICGVHAQVMPAAELSLGRRAGQTRTGVQRALWVERSLVKTFGPRGTVHLLATVDLPTWTGAMSVLPPTAPALPEAVRFTAEESEAVIDAIGRILDGAELTVDELTEALGERVGPWAVERTMPAFQVLWPRWRQLTAPAAHRGVLCFGPDRGRNVTYTNPRRWLAEHAPVDGATAVRTLLRRYLHAYGPATPQHLAKWLAIPPRRAVEALDAMADELERVEFAGTPSWVLAGDTTTPQEPPPGIRLLPYFDAYVVAGQPRERLYPGAAGTRALTPSGQAGNYPVMLVDGVVGGVWQLRRSGRRLEITVEPLAPLSAGQRRELDDEVALVGRVLEGEPSLTVGTLTVGAHA